MPRPNPRDPETDPAAALGESLRDLRADAGFRTQEDFSKATGYARETISRAETGDSLPGSDMLNDWLDACDATLRERKLIDRQYKLARKARGPIPQYFEVYVSREKKAVFVRLWGLDLIPGPLQTYEYAHAMFILEGLDEEEASAKAAARVERGSVMDDPDAAQVTAVIHERALRTLVGTPEIMASQLAHLDGRSRQRNVIIQIVPDTGYFPGMRGAFQIISGPAFPDTVDLETVEDHVTDEPAAVSRVAALFEEIRSYAVNAKESRSLLTEADERWNSQQQQ
jgi:transcriptional regulator with XRE-family HTH domain